VVEAIASEDEDTCYGLVFKRKMGADVAVPANSASDGRASSFRENPPNVSSPRDLVVREGRGRRVPLEVILACLSLLSCPPFSRRFFIPSKVRKWRAKACRQRSWGLPHRIQSRLDQGTRIVN